MKSTGDAGSVVGVGRALEDVQRRRRCPRFRLRTSFPWIEVGSAISHLAPRPQTMELVLALGAEGEMVEVAFVVTVDVASRLHCRLDGGGRLRPRSCSAAVARGALARVQLTSWIFAA